MAVVKTQDLLPVLNQTGLQKDNNRLYQVLQMLIGNLGKTEQTIVSITGGGSSPSGFVTSILGGTNETLAMFTTPHNIENCDQVAVSAALDLL